MANLYPDGPVTYSAPHGHYYATIAGDTDVTAALNAPATRIVAGTAGDVVLTLEDGNDAQTYLAAGVPQYWVFTTIKASGTTAAKITVGV